jgi:hypothetical protein
MLESINEFVNNNSTLVLLGLVAIVVLIGFVMFRRSTGSANANMPVPTPSHDLEGLDNTNMVCDLANGVCMPQQQPEYHQEMPMEMEQQHSMEQQGNMEQQH